MFHEPNGFSWLSKIFRSGVFFGVMLINFLNCGILFYNFTLRKKVSVSLMWKKRNISFVPFFFTLFLEYWDGGKGMGWFHWLNWMWWGWGESINIFRQVTYVFFLSICVSVRQGSLWILIVWWKCIFFPTRNLRFHRLFKFPSLKFG